MFDGFAQHALRFCRRQDARIHPSGLEALRFTRHSVALAAKGFPTGIVHQAHLAAYFFQSVGLPIQ